MLWFDDDNDPLLSWLSLIGSNIPIEVLLGQRIAETIGEIFISLICQEYT